MTNKFVDYAFEASGTGVTTSRTQPDRLSDIANVKDFGAVGDGVTDDWAAITAALQNHWITLVTNAPTTSGNVLHFASVPPELNGSFFVNGTNISGIVSSTTSTTVTVNNSVTGTVASGSTIVFPFPHAGTVFFPPGTYLVSQPIDFSISIFSVGFLGVMGASMVTGNFNDYVFKRDSDSGYGGYHAVEKLTVINTHATGGGIQIGGCVGGAVRDCNVTANYGINTGATNDLSSLEIVVDNCTVIAHSTVAGSIGLLAFADGPLTNCYVNGFDRGAISWGNEGGQSFLGCRFENCSFGYVPGQTPTLGTGGSGGFVVEGCYFKNCGTGIYFLSSGTVSGVLIEGTNGQAPGGTDPQYGIYVPSGRGANVYSGISINGQFAQYGVFIENTIGNGKSLLFGVISTNSGAGSAWGSGFSPATGLIDAAFAKRLGCNVSPITQTNRVVFSSPISSVTCSVNTATLTWAFGDLSAHTGQTFGIVVSGVGVSGYNGAFQGTITGGNTITYTVVGPLANSSGGNILININTLSEGDTFDINDSDVTTWGTPVLGGGSTHALVRFNGTTLDMVGK